MLVYDSLDQENVGAKNGGHTLCTCGRLPTQLHCAWNASTAPLWAATTATTFMVHSEVTRMSWIIDARARVLNPYSICMRISVN